MTPRQQKNWQRKNREEFEAKLKDLIDGSPLENFIKAQVLFRACDQQIFEYGYDEGYRTALLDNKELLT